MVQRPIHVGFALALVFLMSPFMNKKNNQLAFVVDLSLTLAVVACSIYVVFHQARLMERIAYVDNVLPLDLVLGTVFVVLLIIAGWRNMGPALPIICIVFLAYLFWGDGLPGILAHRGATLDQFVELQFMTTGGIFGSPIEVSVSTVYYFMLFGAFGLFRCRTGVATAQRTSGARTPGAVGLADRRCRRKRDQCVAVT